MTAAKYEVLVCYMKVSLMGCKPLTVVVMGGILLVREMSKFSITGETSPQRVLQIVLRGGGNGKFCM